ncbi:hypothetical protein G9A89_014608 [Geosiphon pyriformis]|nr:hypothetical protein G9A89_014608 [Geosiphon pyriformis]
MQELQLSQNAVCDHFKPTNLQPLIELEKKTKKPTWEAYQVLWTDVDHNELPLILAWDEDDYRKEKQKEEHI